jgi:hypothetical protein
MRQQTLQPVFGILKSVRGSGQVPIARAQELPLEWTSVLPGCNLKRPCRQGMGLKRALAR